MPDKPRIQIVEGGVGVAYVSMGHGPVILLVHGSLCDYRFWTPQLLGLNSRYKVLAPSLSHYHPVLPSAQRLPFSWLQHVSLLARFIRQTQAGRVFVVGHSRGAAIAWQLAVQHPDLVSRLCLLDPGGPSGESETLPPATQVLRDRAVHLIDSGETDAGLRLFIESVSRPGYWDKTGAGFKQMARDNAQTLKLQLADALPRYLAAQARSVRTPVLLMQGEHSPRMYRENVASLASWLPDAVTVTVKGASHGMSLTHADFSNQVIGDFMAGISTPA